VLIENMHDRPYLNGSVGPEVVSTMATVCTELKREFPSVPFGVQILAGLLILWSCWNVVL
jgi:predicted TIM-barrel enzyme